MGHRGVFFPAEPPEDARGDRSKKRAEQQCIAKNRHTEKGYADGTDEEQRTGVIGKSKNMLGLL